MRNKMFLVFALGLTAGWLSFGGGGQAIAQAITGLWSSHSMHESYRISIGVDPTGKPRTDEKVAEIRVQYNLPMHYGNLIGVTGHGGAGVLWYQDSSGIIRNAIIPDAASSLSRIEYTATKRLEIEPLR